MADEHPERLVGADELFSKAKASIADLRKNLPGKQ